MHITHRTIRLRKYEQQISIGFYEFEKLRPQRVLIDVDLSLAPLESFQADDVSTTVNYDLLHKEIPKLTTGRHFNLQETLCHEILQMCVQIPGVLEARVWVRKPDIYADCESVGYEARAAAG